MITYFLIYHLKMPMLSAADSRLFMRIALRKLDVLNGAHRLNDLKSPPANRLEALKGDLAGFHSIRVNDQWRLIFRWDEGVHDVSLTDYL